MSETYSQMYYRKVVRPKRVVKCSFCGASDKAILMKEYHSHDLIRGTHKLFARKCRKCLEKEKA